MVPINRRKVSLYEEAKNGLSSLVWQTATVFVGFIIMLLLTGGNPSGFAITIIFVLGIAFVAWREQKRFIKLWKDPDGSFDIIKKRIRRQKGIENQTKLSKSANKMDQSIVSLSESELNALNKIYDRQQSAIRNAGGQGSFADLELEEKKLILAEKLALLKLNPLSQQQQFEADSDRSKYRYYIAVPATISTDQNFTGRAFKFSVATSSGLGLSGATIVDSNSAYTVVEVVTQESASSDIKARLFELRTAIVKHENLTDKSKADALRHLEAITDSLQQNETTIQT